MTVALGIPFREWLKGKGRERVVIDLNGTVFGGMTDWQAPTTTL